MNIIENDAVRNRLLRAFSKGFVNENLEFIVHPGRNSYIALRGVENEEQLNAKILEWLSREAIKGGTRQSMAYHLNGINTFLETDFTREQMEVIYTRLGNACNHKKTLRFLRAGFDMDLLGVSTEREST